ncbi:MAG: 30S ribosomal protein S3 [Methanobrevibacter sp.]|jgi:small subunit ribosomal protein S3|nr:30S ribosomal protein S3 [Methanobrevibacter sp.]
MIEKDFVTEGLKRTKIDEYLEDELERAGYGGMDVQVTPLGTMIVVYAERPGMVIGRGGKTVRAITNTLKNEFDLDNPQVEVKEVDVPELNPKIMASKIANMLQRGMHFRRVAYSTIRRIMGAGAQGVEVTISGKIRGSRSAVAKFVEGYIKKCGEPSTRFVKEGFATVQLKPGVLGIFVRIMPPEAILPDKVDILPPKGETIENKEESEEENTKSSDQSSDEIVEDKSNNEEPSDSELVEEEKELEELEELEEIEELEEVSEEIAEKAAEEEAKEEIIEELAEEEVEEEAIEEAAEKIIKEDENDSSEDSEKSSK